MKLNLQPTKELLVVCILGLIALVILIAGGIGLSWYGDCRRIIYARPDGIERWAD